MNNHNPYFASRKPPAAAQAKINFDPENQLLCPCGGEYFDQVLRIFRVPGQILGSFDITWQQVFVCHECGDPLGDLVKIAKTRREYDQERQEESPS
jgi:hypothetical protein